MSDTDYYQASTLEEGGASVSSTSTKPTTTTATTTSESYGSTSTSPLPPLRAPSESADGAGHSLNAPAAKDAEPHPWTHYALRIGIACVMGFCFGFSLEKARVFEPAVVIDQFKFKRWLMLKTFLSAVAASSFVLTVLSVAPFSAGKFAEARDAFRVCRGWPVVASGTFILGCGMAIAGACPGTVLAQIGAGIDTAPLVFAGGLVGALAYSPVEPWIKPFWKVGLFPRGRETADRLFGVHYAKLAMPFAVMMIVASALLENFIPWREDYEVPASADQVALTGERAGPFSAYAWPPALAGAIIGSMQGPAVVFLSDTIGSASSYATLVSNAAHAVVPGIAKENDHLRRTRNGLGNWWQVAYVAMAILGSLSSAVASGALSDAKGVSVWRSLLGGFLILFGSRIAAGCTSGHGISGMALLCLVSFIAVPSMFAGGIVVALIPGI